MGDNVTQNPTIFETISENGERIIVWEIISGGSVRKDGSTLVVSHNSRILSTYSGFDEPCVELGDPLTKPNPNDWP